MAMEIDYRYLFHIACEKCVMLGIGKGQAGDTSY